MKSSGENLTNDGFFLMRDSASRQQDHFSSGCGPPDPFQDFYIHTLISVGEPRPMGRRKN
jgi:hypothetical protein